MKISLLVHLILSFALVVLCPYLRAQEVIGVTVPNSLSGTNGNSSQDRPFSGTAENDRYQQVYSASEFSAINNGGGLIYTLSFRGDENAGLQQGIVSNLVITLSTTTKAPDSLSPVFAENMGHDATLVYGPKTYNFGQDANIRFDTPFFYNPSAGNLLLDIRRSPSRGMGFVSFDAHDVLGDSISSMYSVGSLPTASIIETRGLVTTFVIIPVPEPATWAFCAFGVLFFLPRALNRGKPVKDGSA